MSHIDTHSILAIVIIAGAIVGATEIVHWSKLKKAAETVEADVVEDVEAVEAEAGLAAPAEEPTPAPAPVAPAEEPKAPAPEAPATQNGGRPVYPASPAPVAPAARPVSPAVEEDAKAA